MGSSIADSLGCHDGPLLVGLTTFTYTVCTNGLSSMQAGIFPESYSWPMKCDHINKPCMLRPPYVYVHVRVRVYIVHILSYMHCT